MIQQVQVLPFKTPGNVLIKGRFGCSQPAYEKAISLKISDIPSDTVSMKQPNSRPQVFIRPVNQVAGLFPKDNAAATYVANLLQAQVAGKAGKAFKDEGGNIFSLIGAKQKAGQWANSIAEAFNRAFVLLPKAARHVGISLPKAPDAPETLVRDLAEKTVLQGYNPYMYRQNPTHPRQHLLSVTLNNLTDSPAVRDALKEGSAIGRGMNLTRYLVDAPPDDVKSPRWMGEQAKAVAAGSRTLQVEVRDRQWIEDQKMGLFLSVAAGNRQNDQDSPRLIEMVYTPANGKFDKTVMLVGKGIIMDTGGVNLKTGKNPKTGELYIHGMHGDMAGAAAVIGTMKTLDELQPENVRVVALAPVTPNRIGENATLPGSKKTARNGKTVYIENTDAEGRLILADAMHYGGEKYKPNLIVDIATLTGGKVGGLGGVNAVAVMGNKHSLSQKVARLETEIGRKTAALRLTREHKNWVTASGQGDADVYNSVSMQEAERFNVYGKGVKFDADKHIIHHSAQGGAFLKEFLHDPKTPWVHLDIAGAEFEPLEHMGGKEIATGVGVKELYLITKRFAEGKL